LTTDVARPDPSTLKIYYTTLRDGEQMPGVALSPAQKFEIACEISRLGCHIVDLCLPLVSPEEAEFVRLIGAGRAHGEIRGDLELLVMCRASPIDIDRTLEITRSAGFGPDEVTFLLFTSASPLHVKYKLGSMLLRREGRSAEELVDTPLEFFHEANKRLVREVIGYAVDRGVKRIEFGGEDASRTSITQLIDLVLTAVEAGACRYVFADTTGSLTPEATRFYCSELVEALPDIELVSHFHNDFDLATVNTVTGILHGFTTFTTTINGLGERAGNAPLHAVVTCLKYLYDLEIPGFRYDRLRKARDLVERLTGIPVQVTEPVIGDHVFRHESGIHTHGVGISRRTYEAIPCEEVGAVSSFLYGKHSGTANLSQLLLDRQDEIGCIVDSEFVLEVLDEVKQLRKHLITQGETQDFIARYYANLHRLGLHDDQVVEIARTVADRRLPQRRPA
jgi:isopropylmalate/homocitrate/citramalate synthase